MKGYPMLLALHPQSIELTMNSFLIMIFFAISVVIYFLLNKFRSSLSKTVLPLPPGPPGLPIIGNLHELDTSNLAYYLWCLSKHYGPLMSLRLGRVQTLVVSSAEMAKEVMKTKDLIFCNRPVLTGQRKLSYDNKDIAFSPYNDYWRQMRKICTLHLFSMKKVNSFRGFREEEVFDMIETIKNRIEKKELVNLSEILIVLTTNIISRIAFGKRPMFSKPDRSPDRSNTCPMVGPDRFSKHWKSPTKCDRERQDVTQFSDLVSQCQSMFVNFFYRDHFPIMGWLDILNGSMGRLEKTFKDMDEFYQEVINEHQNQNERNHVQEDMIDILLKHKQDSNFSVDFSYDHIKAIIMNILLGGTETSATTVVWAITLLMNNPRCLKKVQREVRNAIENKAKVHEDDLYKLNYLKAVIKETLRLYPTTPLLVSRESRERCILSGYEIPKKTLVYVNAWAVGRDPKCWERYEVFEPERFLGSSVDYKGNDFELIPFGSGRRGCPGMSFGVATVEVTLANLVYSFDWELPEGTSEIDTLTIPGTVARKKNDLRLVAKVYDHECNS